MNISHPSQKDIWEAEHKNPHVLLQMDQQLASSGVKKFYSWLVEQQLSKNLSGIEMGCGKGRNSIWLAEKGIHMTAFDFSESAIEEARRRAQDNEVSERTNFIVHDATTSWPVEDESFDIAIDCFASTDIDNPRGRAFARDEYKRVLKKDGVLMVYTLSTEDEFHRQMIEQNPSEEKNSFTHSTTGKFEKVFDREELLEFYKDFNWIEEQRVEKEAEFFGKSYPCRHFWLILKKA